MLGHLLISPRQGFEFPEQSLGRLQGRLRRRMPEKP
jgi:hypothetical protein